MRCEEFDEQYILDYHSDFVKKNIFDSPANLRPCLPFFWLLIFQFNLLHSNLKTCSTPQVQIQMIARFFSLNPLYQLLNDLTLKYDSEFCSFILDFYVRYFLLIICEIRSNQCLAVLSNFLLQNMSGLEALYTKLAMVHCFFDTVISKCNMFCKFVNLQPGIEYHIKNLSLKDYLSSFYLDIIENLCLDNLFERNPENDCIKCILEVLTSKKIDNSFELNFMHRSLIIQIFKVNEENWRNIDTTMILFSKSTLIEPLKKIITQPELIQD